MSVWVHIKDKDGLLKHYINCDNICEIRPTEDRQGVEVFYIGMKSTMKYNITLEQFRSAMKGE